jgi:hypothetical protein
MKIFSRTSRPILVNRSTNHPWVKKILNFSNKGPSPLQMGDNHKNGKIGLSHLEIFSRQTRLILTTLF